MIKELKELTVPQWLLMVFLFAGAVSPGLLTLWLYKPELIQQLDVVKLLVLALVLTLPFVIWGWLFLMYLTNYDFKSYNLTDFSTLALYLNFSMFYIMLLFAYWQHWSFRYFLVNVIVSMALLSVASFVYRVIQDRRVKSLHDKST